MLEGYPKALENLSNNNVLLTRYRDELDALTIKVNKAVKMSAARPEEIAVSTTEHVTGAKENESQVNSEVQNKQIISTLKITSGVIEKKSSRVRANTWIISRAAAGCWILAVAAGSFWSCSRSIRSMQWAWIYMMNMPSIAR